MRTVRSVLVRISLGGLATLATLGGCKKAAAVRASDGAYVLSVTDKGFEPAEVTAPKGEQVTLRITRKVAETCADAVIVAGDPVRHELPLGTPIDVRVKVPQSGEIAFACPMNMIKGAVRAQ